MPHDNTRSAVHRTESNPGEGLRAERRSERSANIGAANRPFGEIGARSFAARLRLQREMLDLLSDIGREWLTRATSEAEWAFKLPTKLTAARSVQDAFSAYQEWLGEGMNMFGEDSRRFMSDSRKLIDTGVRCFADPSPAAMS